MQFSAAPDSRQTTSRGALSGENELRIVFFFINSSNFVFFVRQTKDLQIEQENCESFLKEISSFALNHLSTPSILSLVLCAARLNQCFGRSLTVPPPRRPVVSSHHWANERKSDEPLFSLSPVSALGLEDTQGVEGGKIFAVLIRKARKVSQTIETSRANRGSSLRR